MADPENPDTTARSHEAPASGDIGLTMSYIISIPGILKIVEFGAEKENLSNNQELLYMFTLLLAFALAADEYATLAQYFVVDWGRMDFFLFVTVTSWLLVIAVFVLFAFNIISKINLSIDWNIPVFVFAVVAAILLLLSSALLAADAAGLLSDRLNAAVAFGFISMFVFIADAVVYFLRRTGIL